MSEQCPARSSDLRCQRTKGHEGRHRAETEGRVHDWADRSKK